MSLSNSESTNYHQLRNRCPDCGHRKDMNKAGKCRVVMGDTVKKDVSHPCKCERKFLNV